MGSHHSTCQHYWGPPQVFSTMLPILSLLFPTTMCIAFLLSFFPTPILRRLCIFQCTIFSVFSICLFFFFDRLNCKNPKTPSSPLHLFFSSLSLPPKLLTKKISWNLKIVELILLGVVHTTTGT